MEAQKECCERDLHHAVHTMCYLDGITIHTIDAEPTEPLNSNSKCIRNRFGIILCRFRCHIVVVFDAVVVCELQKSILCVHEGAHIVRTIYAE